MLDSTPTQTFSLELRGLAPDPIRAWERMQAFLLLDETVVRAMQQVSEYLLQHAVQFVADTYDYLASFDETAAILGWEQKMDEEHLQERRQFFATWFARSIGVDLSEDFALYLFRAGQIHAGHGPRHIHTPEIWVTGSIGHVNSFVTARLVAAVKDRELLATALGGWNRYLSLQLHQMLAGYDTALHLDEGTLTVHVRLYGRLRALARKEQVDVRAHEGAVVADILRKFFDYYPLLRREFFTLQWLSPAEDGAATWVTDFEQVYVPHEGPDWRVLLNGKDLRFHGGLDMQVQDNDILALFPPGR
ncbi:MAG: hypothetical protein GXP38_12125 [Chloroflexi bacterium]|nr:hypothetical protein [Chloroflexota bacterium]